MFTTAVIAAAMIWVAPPAQSQIQELEKDLIAVGAQVPDFELETPDGKKFQLMETLKKNKVTILNFWFFN
jgi:cytochrome oxidase Cu insertion factor (SCO1/SenC/PrrC family)